MPEANPKRIISKLLDKYDKSVLSLGGNKRKIPIFLNVNDKTFPKYIHPESLDDTESIEKDFRFLQGLGIVELEEAGDKVFKISLITEEESLRKAREFVGISNPQEEAERYQKIFLEYLDEEDKTIALFASSMFEKLADHRKLGSVLKYFDDEKTLKKIIKAVKTIDSLEEEVRERNLSISLFSDSKRLALLSSKINRILKEFSEIEFDDKPTPIEQMGVVHNPSFALIKNGVVIRLGNQNIDLSKLSYPMPLYDQSIKEINVVEIKAKRMITVENLTTFYDFEDEDAVIVYLGGFHNRIRKTLIQKIYTAKPGLDCYHWGDIDAGGFNIFNHLVEDTKVPFKPMNMGISELKKYKNLCKLLTDRDIHRLSIQIGKKSMATFHPVIEFMIDNNLKLEQEAFSAFEINHVNV